MNRAPAPSVWRAACAARGWTSIPLANGPYHRAWSAQSCASIPRPTAQYASMTSTNRRQRWLAVAPLSRDADAAKATGSHLRGGAWDRVPQLPPEVASRRPRRPSQQFGPGDEARVVGAPGPAADAARNLI